MDNKSTRIAGIDIGTNTILMLVADKKDEKISIVSDHNSIARLGQGVDKTHRINTDAVQRGIKILYKYSKVCKELKVDEVRAVATSSMRDAENNSDVLAEFEKTLGTDIKVISGEQEAFFSYSGAIESNENALVIDIGGGSTEIIYKSTSGILQSKSLQIGSVRLTERFVTNYPIQSDLIENIKSYILDSLVKSNLTPLSNICYAVAGTPTTIAKCLLGNDDFEINLINGFDLKIDDVKNLSKEFIELTPDEIILKYKIHSQRADVIAVGSLILQTIMEYFKINSCKVSAYGLRLGIIKEISPL